MPLLVLGGLLWALALLLLAQYLFGFTVPTLLDVVAARWNPQWGGVCIGPCEGYKAPLLLWFIYAASHVLQARLLRRLGPFPFSDAQVLFLALVPGYNLVGSVALFCAEGEALERLGFGPGLGRHLRISASLASLFAVIMAVAWVRAIHPFFVARTTDPAVAIKHSVDQFLWGGLALILSRLYVLARLQLAYHRLQEAWRTGRLTLPVREPLDPVAFAESRRLLDPRVSTGVAVLAAMAGASALVPNAGWPWAGLTVTRSAASSAPAAKPAPEPSPIEAAPRVDGEKDSPTAPEVSERPPRVAKPAGPVWPSHAGRTLEWWNGRLVQLRARTDDEGRRLYQATLERAAANGLALVTGSDGPKLEASPASPVTSGGTP